MTNNQLINQVVTLKMRNGAYFQGILLGLGSKWALLKYIPVDFVTDGYVLINTNYISTFDISDKDIFTDKIIKLKQIICWFYQNIERKINESTFNQQSL